MVNWFQARHPFHIEPCFLIAKLEGIVPDLAGNGLGKEIFEVHIKASRLFHDSRPHRGEHRSDLQDDEVYEDALLHGDRFLFETHLGFQNPQKVRVVKDLQPDRAMVLVYGQQVFNFAASILPHGGIAGKAEAANDPCGLQEIEPVRIQPRNKKPHDMLGSTSRGFEQEF